MRQKILVAIVVAVVAAAGLVYGFVQINKADFGVPGFYLWKTVSGEYRGSGRTSVNGVSLYYERYGDGPPVLLLHGAGAFLETMHYFISALAPAHTVIAVDSRGHGRSTDGPGPLTYAQMSDDTIALMDALHIARVDVVGWSDGGIIGLDMAMKHPDRVRRLVAISANYDVAGIEPGQITPAAIRQTAREIEPFYDRIAPDPAHFPVLVRKLIAMLTTEPHYTAAELGTIRAPTLVLAGEHDAILRAHTDALAHAIPHTKEIIVPGATHFGPLEQPDAYDAAVTAFLK